MDDVRGIAADLARQRTDLEAEKKRRQERGENLSLVLAKLAELRSLIEKVRRDSVVDGDALS
jgi:hypothetical protein